MLCPLCKTECRVEVKEGKPVQICRDPRCPAFGKPVEGGENHA